MSYLLKLLDDAVRGLINVFRPKQAFSWQTALFLCLFSWAMAWASVENFSGGLEGVLPSDSPVGEGSPEPNGMLPATRALFTMGWIFLTLSVGWLFAKEKIKIPFLGITLKPAIWVTSALTSAFLFEVWKPDTLSLVLMSWPLIFAAYAALSKVYIVSDNHFTLPKPEVRQQMVITTLICLLASCWVRFHFVMQEWVFEDYPVLQLVDFRSSAFVVQVGESPPVLAIADWTLQTELGRFPIPEARWWLRNANENSSNVDAQFRQNLTAFGEAAAWEMTLSPTLISTPTFALQILPIPGVLLEPEPDVLDDGGTPETRDALPQDRIIESIDPEAGPVEESDSAGEGMTGDRIGLIRLCQIVPTAEVDPQLLAARSEEFEVFRAQQLSSSPRPSDDATDNSEEAPEETEEVETRSLAERFWAWLLGILGLDDPFSSEGDDAEDNFSLDDLRDTVEEGISSLLGQEAEPDPPRNLEDYPSQVICESGGLVLESDL